jgi:hypothetical protein
MDLVPERPLGRGRKPGSLQPGGPVRVMGPGGLDEVMAHEYGHPFQARSWAS